MTTPRREIHVPIYWLIVGLCVMVVSPILSVVASARINEKSTRSAIVAADRAKEEAKSESLVRYCRLIGSQVDVYREAITPVGRDAYQTWLSEYRIQGCSPPR
jgi:hypothetical protein